MKNPILIKPGDIFLVDSKKKGPKMVKFLMTAPTIWQHLWRKLRGTQEEVKYYHAGMFVSKDEIIEQQWKVVQKSSAKLLNTYNMVLIARKKNADMSKRIALADTAKKDLGEGYDVLNIFGKTLTWLFWIPLFEKYMQWPQAEVCINRVAYWCKALDFSTFGAKTHSELTTHDVHKYILANPDEWEIVFEGIPRNN
jgi:hypothetical protein